MLLHILQSTGQPPQQRNSGSRMSVVPQLRFYSRQACAQVVNAEIKVSSEYYGNSGKDILIRTWEDTITMAFLLGLQGKKC